MKSAPFKASNVRGEALTVDPLCLVFFVDDTGHELFADNQYPIFGYGGCAMMAGHVDAEIRDPWAAMKRKHFGGSDVPIHAYEISKASSGQISAIADYFRNGRFQRFASVVDNTANLPAAIDPIRIIAPSLFKRFEELTLRWIPQPKEICIIFESSQRGNGLLEKYVGQISASIDGTNVPIRQGFMEKKLGEPALEVADFITNAAGGQAFHWAKKKSGFRKDFQAVFHAQEHLSSFFCINAAEANRKSA